MINSSCFWMDYWYLRSILSSCICQAAYQAHDDSLVETTVAIMFPSSCSSNVLMCLWDNSSINVLMTCVANANGNFSTNNCDHIVIIRIIYFVTVLQNFSHWHIPYTSIFMVASNAAIINETCMRYMWSATKNNTGILGKIWQSSQKITNRQI